MNPKEMVIVQLKGADRVRKRPGVLFGSDGLAGVERMAKMLLDVFVPEALAGKCPKIEMRVNEDASISVTSHDRGLWLGPVCPPEQSDWYPIFCELYARGYDEPDVARPDWFAPPYQREERGKSMLALETEIALCVVQYASEFMQVEVVRDGERKNLFFERGNYLSGPEVQPCNDASYTRITYRPDPAVFCDIAVAEANYMLLVRQLAFLVPGLVCVFKGSQIGQKEFCYPNGLADCAAELAGERALSPVLAGCCCDETVDVRVALCFVSEGGQTQCCHNFCGIIGGTHIELAREMILRQVGEDITEEELVPHIVLIVDSRNSGHVFWQNGSRAHLGDARVDACIQDLLGADFWRDNREATKAVAEKIRARRR